MMPRAFHHIGYVVASIAESAPGFCRQLGLTWDQRVIHDPIQRVQVTFLQPPVPGEPQIELVEPADTDPPSPVQRFLTAQGGGLHHFCYEVEDLEAALEQMRQAGAAIMRRPQPAVAFDGRRIAWLLTKQRLLVELLEKTARS
jgi:methylmalonyl-CoA/ethylmalonyl-CoA epimerase